MACKKLEQQKMTDDNLCCVHKKQNKNKCKGPIYRSASGGLSLVLFLRVTSQEVVKKPIKFIFENLDNPRKKHDINDDLI